jgi:hypothetical protein
LTNRNEPHNQRNPYSSSDNINAGLGSIYGPNNAKLFCKKSDFKKESNTNTNSADSSSSSNATADNTNNIDNTATATSNQNQNACAIALTCSQGSTTVTPPCNPSTIGGVTAIRTDDTCIATLTGLPDNEQLGPFIRECISIPGHILTIFDDTRATCEFPAT